MSSIELSKRSAQMCFPLSASINHRPDIDRLPLVCEARVARDDEQFGEPRQFGDDVLDDTVGEVILLRITTQIRERQNDDRRLLLRYEAGRQRRRAARRLFFLVDVADEPKTLAGQRFDQPLPLATVADRLAGAVQSRRQRRFRNDASAPDNGHEIVLADDTLSMSDQIDEDIENLRRKGYQVAV
jgi:hypothetical protein